MHIDASFFTTAVSGSKIRQGDFPSLFSCSIDSRIPQKGDIFFALRGERSDGHEFLHEALANGATGVVISQKREDLLNQLPDSILVITVPDPLSALIALARAWRKRFTFPIVALTGSVGKTSTKNLIAHILEQNQSNYLVAHGNQNTQIGVAMNIVRMTDQHDGAVFEIGINQRGEMGRIVDMLRPTTALITAIGHSHMEGLGSLVDIAVEKRDIFKFLKEDSVGFVFGDQDILSAVSYPHPVIKFGRKTTNQIQARKVVITDAEIRCTLKIYNNKYGVVLPYIHGGMLNNILAAVSVTQYLGVPKDTIITAIQKPVVVPRRFQVKPIGDSIMIDDCYNANPESMKAALLALQQLETDAYKVAVLGDMLELGSDAIFWHRQVGRFLRKVPSLKHLVLVGTQVEHTQATAPRTVKVHRVATWEEAVVYVESILSRRSVILVKGSRGVGLDKLVDRCVVQPESSSVQKALHDREVSA
ncbi:UDP-N-acetylmuramoyl-tripeptide--D-alanyl-D-alanine ligase [Candidatus Babeliales bacterium]|nr:UDP-N-acetylmuramoyl-tripeptide--D-alanyl-D-alanine ligase [Candidatus Babeliales bacterium]